MAGSDLLTVTQAARVLGTSSQTIRNWIAAGKLDATRVGSRYQIPQTEIDRLGQTAPRSGEGPWEHAADQPFPPLARKTNHTSPTNNGNDPTLRA